MSSPFGSLSARVFHNHVTAGVISNVVYPEGRGEEEKKSQDPGLYIVDGRIFPGSEGGLVISANGHFVGLVSPPLRNKETPVELNLVIPARSVLKAFAEFFPPSLTIDSQITPLATLAVAESPINVAEKAQQAVVMISISGTWASGVIVSPDGCQFSSPSYLSPVIHRNMKSFRCRCAHQCPRGETLHLLHDPKAHSASPPSACQSQNPRGPPQPAVDPRGRGNLRLLLHLGYCPSQAPSLRSPLSPYSL